VTIREQAMSERPRVSPLSPSELEPETEELLAKTGKRDSNMFKTLLRHPRLAKRWVPFGYAILNGTLPVRDRELLVLGATQRASAQTQFTWCHVSRDGA